MGSTGSRITETLHYLYEYDKVVLEVDGNGTQTARNVYGTNLISRTADGQKYTYLYNGQADVTALVRPNGTIAASYYYDAWGVPLEENYFDVNGNPTQEKVNNPIRYAGYQWDSETELYYLNSRHYNPVIARFMQEDTYRGDFNDPLSLNLYTYVLNNPLKYDDPTGYNANKKGQVVFLTHGLNGNATEFQATIGNLKTTEPDKYISFGIVTAGRGDANGQYYTGSDQAGLYMNDDVREKGIELFGKDFQNDPAKVAQLMDHYTDQGFNVLVRTEFSTGNLSFADQRTEFGTMVNRFGSFTADVTFVGHSMGGLASINYGITYATNNPKKNVNVITVSTPYHPNSWASARTTSSAKADLTDSTGNLTALRNRYNNNRSRISTYAINIAKAGGESDDERDKIGDGIVDIPSQTGAKVRIQDKNKKPEKQTNWEYVGVKIQPMIESPDKEFWTNDAANTGHTHHHVNTPDLMEVAQQINNILK